MQETSSAILRAIMLADPTLTGPERKALHQFLETGLISVVVAEGPLLFTAVKAAEFVGVSTDTFRKIRDQAARRSIRDLCGVEITPGNYMFERVALIKFSQGKFGLDWPSMNDNRVVGFENTGSCKAEGKAS